METFELLNLARRDGASSESIIKLTEALEDLDIPSDLKKKLPPAIQFIGPRPWINTIKALYSKGRDKGGTFDERN